MFIDFNQVTLNVGEVNETTYLKISIDGVEYLNFRDFNTYFSALCNANSMNFLNILTISSQIWRFFLNFQLISTYSMDQAVTT